MPYIDFIAPTQEAALKIPKGQASELKRKVRQVLKKSMPSKPNFSKEEKLPIKSQHGDKNIIILPAGITNLLKDKVEYFKKLSALIGSGIYFKVKKGPDPED